MTDFPFWGCKITVVGDCSHEIRRLLLLGRTPMKDPGGVLESKDITADKGPHSQGCVWSFQWSRTIVRAGL